MATLHFKAITLDQITLNYIERPGSGPPLVLVHGATGSLDAYLNILDDLARLGPLYALDLRGHGLSGHAHDPEAYRVEDFGRDLQQFLQVVVGEPAVLAGHSLGGLVATWVAAQANNTLLGVLLEDPPMYKGLMPAVKETIFYPNFINLKRNQQAHLASGASAEAWTKDLAGWPYDERRTMLEAVGDDGVRLRAWQLHQLDPFVLDSVIAGTLTDNFNPDELLPRVRCPVHLLAGQYHLGAAMDSADVERVVSLLPQVTYKILAGVGHRLHQDQPAEYLQELREFLSRITAH